MLLILCSLGCDQVESDVVLSVFGQIHVFHSSVGDINLLLEVTLFLGNVTDQDGHLTENDSVVKNQANEHNKNVYDLPGGTRSHFVTTQGKDGHVQDNHVLIHVVDLLKIVKAVVTAPLDIDKVEGWHPLFRRIHNHKPNAANDVHDQEQGQDELEYLNHSFLVLLELQLLNDFGKAGDSGDFEDFEQLEWADIENRPRNGSNEIDKEHAFNVANCNPFLVSHFLTSRRKISRSELNKNID